MKIYIDVNTFVSYVRKTEINHEKSKIFIDFILNKDFLKEILFFTSRFSSVGVASAIYRRTSNQDKARATLHKLERPWSNKILPLPEKPDEKIKIDDLVIKLVETALKYGTKFEDTIHANDVESYEIDYLVTWNTKDFKKLERKIKRLKVLTPPQMLEILKKIKSKKEEKSNN